MDYIFIQDEDGAVHSLDTVEVEEMVKYFNEASFNKTPPNSVKYFIHALEEWL